MPTYFFLSNLIALVAMSGEKSDLTEDVRFWWVEGTEKWAIAAFHRKRVTLTQDVCRSNIWGRGRRKCYQN